jgi:hypothetical protein
MDAPMTDKKVVEISYFNKGVSSPASGVFVKPDLSWAHLS